MLPPPCCSPMPARCTAARRLSRAQSAPLPSCNIVLCGRRRPAAPFLSSPPLASCHSCDTLAQKTVGGTTRHGSQHALGGDRRQLAPARDRQRCLYAAVPAEPCSAARSHRGCRSAAGVEASGGRGEVSMGCRATAGCPLHSAPSRMSADGCCMVVICPHLSRASPWGRCTSGACRACTRRRGRQTGGACSPPPACRAPRG